MSQVDQSTCWHQGLNALNVVSTFDNLLSIGIDSRLALTHPL